MINEETRRKLAVNLQALREVVTTRGNWMVIRVVIIQAAKMWTVTWPEQATKLIDIMNAHLPGEKGAEKAFKEAMDQFLTEAEEALNKHVPN